MKKSFYFVVNQSEVKDYTQILDLMKVPYMIENSLAVLKEGAGQSKIVFPDIPIKLYSMVRKLFKTDGKPYETQ